MFEKDDKIVVEDQMEPVVRTGKRVDDTIKTDEVPGKKRRRLGPLPWLLLIVGLCVGVLGGFYLRPLVMPEDAEASAAPVVEAKGLDEVDRAAMQQVVMDTVLDTARHFEGDPNAPVTLVEFGDFKCGYCGKWNHETLSLIREKYVETGKVRLAYVNYPILGPGSMAAAEAAECAAQQGKFWEYAELLYDDQRSSATPENFIVMAGELELDTDAFEGCLAEFPNRESLDNDIRVGQMLGVRGTPAFLVNGVPLSGALPYEVFKQAIEGALDGDF
jgi:protein-disulfide isomerase